MNLVHFHYSLIDSDQMMQINLHLILTKGRNKVTALGIAADRMKAAGDYSASYPYPQLSPLLLHHSEPAAAAL